MNRKIDGDCIVYYDGASAVLTVEEKSTEQGILIKLLGQLRSDIAYDIQDELIAFTTVGAKITVDFEKVSYIAPTAQHIFLRVQQKMDACGKGTLVMKKLPDEIYMEFEKTGVSELLLIEN